MSYSPFRVILHGRIASRHDFGKGCVLFLLRIALRFLMIMPRGAYNSRPGGGGDPTFFKHSVSCCIYYISSLV